MATATSNVSTISIGGKDKQVVQGAAAFSKGIAVLQMIFEAKQPPTLNELVKKSGMTRPTMHRILKALASEGLVSCGAGKTYKLGARLIQFSAKALEHNELAHVAAPFLDWLCAQTQEAIHMGTLSGGEMIYLAKRDCPISSVLRRTWEVASFLTRVQSVKRCWHSCPKKSVKS